jgi:hypothetical protein
MGPRKGVAAASMEAIIYSYKVFVGNPEGKKLSGRSGICKSNAGY